MPLLSPPRCLGIPTTSRSMSCSSMSLPIRSASVSKFSLIRVFKGRTVTFKGSVMAIPIVLEPTSKAIHRLMEIAYTYNLPHFLALFPQSS